MSLFVVLVWWRWYKKGGMCPQGEFSFVSNPPSPKNGGQLAK